MSIPTARTPSFTGRAASAATTRKARSEMRKTPLKSAQRRTPVDGMDKPPACPPGPQENKSRRSGQMMGYQNRTTSFAIDSRHSALFFAAPHGAAFAVRCRLRYIQKDTAARESWAGAHEETSHGDRRGGGRHRRPSGWSARGGKAR